VSLNPNNGPVAIQARITNAAMAKTQGLPLK
jgi:hypothetical protein